MTNPIDQLESLFAQTTQGEWAVDPDVEGCRNITTDLHNAPYGVDVLYTPGLANDEMDFSNARHSALMHNVMPALLELLKCTAKAEFVRSRGDLGSIDTLLCLIKHKHNSVLDALRKELEK